MHQKCTAMTAMYMYFAILYNVYCEFQIFVCCINQQKCNIHIFINARKKDKLVPYSKMFLQFMKLFKMNSVGRLGGRPTFLWRPVGQWRNPRRQHSTSPPRVNRGTC